MILPAGSSSFVLRGAGFLQRIAAIGRTAIFVAAWSLPILLAGCSSEPLISRHGVSGLALGEMGLEAAVAMTKTGGSAPQTLELEDWCYIGGVIPVKKSAFEGEHRADNGTRLFVDGHKRGMVPWVGTVRKPGPHQVRLELRVFEPYTLTLGEPFLLHTPKGDLEAWPPVIVHMLTGEVFTTQETSAVDVDRNSGTRKKTDIAKIAGRDPLLIVTTTTKVQPGWRKLGQMRVVGQPAGSESRDQVRNPALLTAPQ